MPATIPLHQPYQDSDGSPLDGGYLYFGVAGQNPITNPITVYWDAALTIPASQPIRTVNGYISNNGSPANIFTAVDYSLIVKNIGFVTVYSESTSANSFFGTIISLAASAGSSLIGFIQSGVGAVVRTVQSKLRESLSVTDFGAAGDGVTDDTTAISNAVTAAAGKRILFPDGSYLVSTSLTIPSNTEIVFEAGAKILAGANNLTVFTTSGFTSNIQLRNPNIDGNTHTGVTGINLSNVQFQSFVDNPNIYRCQYGIKLVSTCIGVSIFNPTTYDVDNGIQILASNANAIYTPNLDNSVASGGNNSGTGIFITGSSNQVYGGFIQGFQYGYYDQGDYNGVNGTYYESCTDSANYLDAALGTTLNEVFFYGYNTVAAACHLCAAVNSKGVSVMFPKMIQGNSTGGLYYFVTGNSECYEIHNTDGGTTNTSEGTRTQIAKVMKQMAPTAFTPVVEGSAVAGTGTYTTQSGTYVQHGNVVHFNIKIAWSAHTGSGDLIINGLPVGAAAGFASESFQLTPSAFAVTGPHVRGYFSSATPHIRGVEVSTTGVVANIALPGAGGLDISGTYFAA